MSTDQSVKRDERTVAVENAGYKWAYSFVVFALLFDVMYRSMFRNEAAWDLLAFVIVGGAICAIFQYRQKTLNRPSWKSIFLLVACCIVTSVFAVMMAIKTM